MAQDSKNPLARIHAIWTLEGLDSLTPQLLHAKLLDENPQVRATAIRAAETLLKKGNTALIADIKALKADPDPTVVLQTMMTAKVLNWPEWKKEAAATLSMSPSGGVREIGSQLLIEPPKISGKFTKEQKKQIENGQEVFRSLCFACHGFDGKGMPMPGREGVTLAPPLAGSKTAVQGDSVIRVLLQGLAGPVDGKTYEAQMVSMGANPDQWIADVACYLRKAFDNDGALVTKEEVKRLREATKARTAPWTIEELRAGFPQPLTNTKDWKLTASTAKDLQKAVDGDAATRWTTGAFQVPGQWFQIELPADTEIAGILLDTVRSRNDYPRGYKVELSNDGHQWGKPSLQGSGTNPITELNFPRPVKTRFIRITQTGVIKGNYWSIHEVQVLKPVEKSSAPKTAAK